MKENFKEAKIVLSKEGKIVYENGDWLLVKEKVKENGEIKTKKYTFTNFYNLLLSCQNFVNVDQEDKIERIKKEYYKKAKLVIRHIKELDNKEISIGNSIENAPSSVIYKTTQGYIGKIIRTSDNNNSGLAVDKKYPGNPKQFSIQVFNVEMGERIKKHNLKELDDLYEVLIESSDFIIQESKNTKNILENDQ